MQFRATEFLVALVALVGAFLSTTNPAHAHGADCAVPLAYEYEFEQNDTPECLLVYAGNGSEGAPPSLEIQNNCEETANFDKLECESCQEESTVESGSRGNLELVGEEMEDGETSHQTYAWTLGDREGIVETAVTYQEVEPGDRSCNDTAPPTYPGAACSTTGAGHGPSPIGTGLALLALGLLGARKILR